MARSTRQHRHGGEKWEQRDPSLKDEVDGDLYVSGSGTLVRAMLADGLVDELHLLVYPVTRGVRSAALPRGSRARQPVAFGL
jgi:dihydrofolate reductase